MPLVALLAAGGGGAILAAGVGSWQPLLVLTGYSIAVVIASIVGGNLTQRVRMTHNSMQHVISLVGGVMLGTALFHLLPHALHGSSEGGVTVDRIMTAVVLGIVAMFGMLRLFHHHHHGEELAFHNPVEREAAGSPQAAASRANASCQHQHAHGHDDEHGHGHGHEQGEDQGAAGQAAGQAPAGVTVGRHSWLGVLVGLMIHTLIDGVTLAASVQMDATHLGPSGLFLGFGTFLAVFLHKPLDAISITSMMAASGQSERKRDWANFAFALTCPLGAAICYAGIATGGPTSSAVVAYVLAFSAGVFLCIALSDLLPEMEFHSHDRFTLTAMLLLGLLAAWMLRFLEGDLHGG